jgi:hypothetical protein
MPLLLADQALNQSSNDRNLLRLYAEAGKILCRFGRLSTKKQLRADLAG